MKNFLESLYQIENFGIYLFVFIGVLIVLFLVILFFGKKDSDKEEKENTELPKVIEEPKKEEPLFKEVNDTIPVETPHLKNENIEVPMPTVNNVLNEEIPSFEKQEKSTVGEEPDETPKE